MRLLVTGGCGFIGSAVVRLAIARGHRVVNLDALTYAACHDNVADVADNPAYTFAHADIRDRPALDELFAQHRPEAVIHLAAESHVDRSIDGPADFIATNVMGTCTLLEAARAHWIAEDSPSSFRFVHVSTDEVYGPLGAEGVFREDTAYAPSSPYAASKAGADHLVRAWHRTYGLPTVLTNCSNNYGPYQFPEKLIPVVIVKALTGETIPVYGRGDNVRDWLYVEDHADALLRVLTTGAVGATYNIGGDNQVRNLDLVRLLCSILDGERPGRGSYADRISFVADRPGHDYRYAIDASRIHQELGWCPQTELMVGLRRTVRWYLDNEAWWRPVKERLGLGRPLGAVR